MDFVESGSPESRKELWKTSGTVEITLCWIVESEMKGERKIARESG
jgi:hypothetical protein